MLKFIGKRFLMMIPTVLIISVIVFFIIQLPPGDFMNTYISSLEEGGEQISLEMIAEIRSRYGLDKPWYVQYYKWMEGIITRFDWGYSFAYNMPVMGVLGQRMGTTLLISLITMVFTYLVSIPAGIYSSVKQYSPGDYVITAIGFLGMATPNFLFAIILMLIAYATTGNAMLGLVSQEFANAPMSWLKLLDIAKHMIIPIIVIGTANTCGLIRIMRGQMLDELSRQYVITARAKGLSERKILYKYCVRAALNPIASSIGWSLTSIFTGSTITAIVLNLPTQGPVLQKALLSQDMYLAGSWLLMMTVLTVIGTLVSDLLLAWLDPRIRFSKRGVEA